MVGSEQDPDHEPIRYGQGDLMGCANPNEISSDISDRTSNLIFRDTDTVALPA
ncbi:unnamed protein product [Penicillium roqueforti FM164]|uniref:Genomic scaffold, ProqFM164S02 n=1 Tax=Penicillium roqueforti (strain FM164) TaxID=1365484 RepID=W6Q139_PENRF|nr:unnamed protein product [Penicillium roqueforti FM164]